MNPIATAALTPQARLRRYLMTAAVMAATIMQVLDITVANVALPHMQGSLSASLDQVNWVLTSYIVASAIMTAPIGWLADRFGRKRLFVVCTVGFTIASFLCALAQNIEQIVLFRLLQGMAGAALVPLSQSVMLDAYPLEERGQAMAVWGVGVMLGPILGPTLGAWLTENYSWHWIFLINLPVGAITVLGLMLFVEETKPRAIRFDWFGFGALAVGLGALQLMLDRGQQVGWFSSSEIVIEAAVAAAGFYYFFAHSLTTPEPFVRFALFKDRNFLAGVLFMAVMGVVLFSTLALASPFIQTVMAYPIVAAGYLLSSRGLGTLFGMMSVGRLLQLIEARWLIGLGLGLSAFTLWEMSYFTNDTSAFHVAWVSMVQGLGLGLVFIPLNTVAFKTLPGHLRTDGTAMLTLVRNIGSSIGISWVISNLVDSRTIMHANLVEHITPFSDALQMPNVTSVLDLTSAFGRAMLDRLIDQQALIIAFANDFRMLMLFTIAMMPFVLMVGSSRMRSTAPREAVAVAMD